MIIILIICSQYTKTHLTSHNNNTTPNNNTHTHTTTQHTKTKTKTSIKPTQIKNEEQPHTLRKQL